MGYPRLVKGRFPARNGWAVEGVVGDAPEWFVWRKVAVTKGGWIGIKVHASEPIEGKANYHLAWNGVRLAVSREALALDAGRPALARQVRRFLKALPVAEIGCDASNEDKP